MSGLKPVVKFILAIMIVGVGFYMYGQTAGQIGSTRDFLTTNIRDLDIVTPTEVDAVFIFSRDPDAAAVGDCRDTAWGYQPFKDSKINTNRILIRFSEKIGWDGQETGEFIMPDFVKVYMSYENREELVQLSDWGNELGIRPKFGVTNGKKDRRFINISILDPDDGFIISERNYYLLITFETETTQLTPITIDFREGKTLDDRHNCLMTEVS